LIFCLGHLDQLADYERLAEELKTAHGNSAKKARTTLFPTSPAQKKLESIGAVISSPKYKRTSPLYIDRYKANLFLNKQIGIYFNCDYL
jgi:hypothetical protein